MNKCRCFYPAGVDVETDSIETALAVFRRCGGVLRTSEAIRQGIHPRTLYALRDSGVIQLLSRGLYRLADLPPLSNPDLVIIACKFSPSGDLPRFCSRLS